MKLRSSLFAVLALAACASFSTQTAQAAIACGSLLTPANNITAANGSVNTPLCSIDGLDFSNFFVSVASNTGNSPQVLIGSGSGLVGSVANLVFQIVGGNIGQITDISIYYKVSAASAVMTGITSFVPASASNVTLQEGACASTAAQSSSQCLGAVLTIPFISIAAGQSDTRTFAAQQWITVQKDLHIGAFVGPTNFTLGTITDFTNGTTIGSVPEPMTLSMMGAGLLALGMIRRKK